MSPLIHLQAVSYTTPDGHRLFPELDLSFTSERTGLVGHNAAGKTTLLRLIEGLLPPSAGKVVRRGSIGVLRQQVQVSGHTTVAERLGVADALSVLQRLEAGTGGAEDLEQADWTLEPRIADALAAVGLPGLDPQRPVGGLSGGQVTRLALAQLLIERPDIILLDEPTNNLDREGRATVADLLSAWSGGAIVVSHDRALLRRMDRIVELSPHGAKVTGGNWDAYTAQREAERVAAHRSLEVAERSLRQADRSIQQTRERKAKRDAAGRRLRRSGSQSKLILDAQKGRSEQSLGQQRTVENRLREDARRAVADARAKIEVLEPMRFALPATGLPGGRLVLAFDAAGWTTQTGAPILRDISFTITGPERIALTGPNGSGKTTLLRLATGDIDPTIGTVHRPASSAKLDQQVSVLDPDTSILENFRRLRPDDTDNACRAALARFRFRADAALQPVGRLSGGEMLRAGLAVVLGGQTPPELLILDEPTNHLDLESIAAVESALRDYDGALLVASHDEDFLEAIGTTRRIDLPPLLPEVKE